MKTLAYSLYELHQSVQRIVGGLQPVALLLGRLYVAWVFLKAGLTKIDDWGTTLFLFEEEYSMPLARSWLPSWRRSGNWYFSSC